jgi:hypothetical protein
MYRRTAVEKNKPSILPDFIKEIEEKKKPIGKKAISVIHNKSLPPRPSNRSTRSRDYPGALSSITE